MLKLVSLFLCILILSIKNNIPKTINGKCEKHYHEIERSMYCGIAEYFYLIPTIKANICGSYFQIEIDILCFYIAVSYKIIDVDESGCL